MVTDGQKAAVCTTEPAQAVTLLEAEKVRGKSAQAPPIKATGKPFRSTTCFPRDSGSSGLSRAAEHRFFSSSVACERPPEADLQDSGPDQSSQDPLTPGQSPACLSDSGRASIRSPTWGDTQLPPI
ncbi:hypothetical protein SKAU_G00289920 [Synaphobranchus kaupii]|uniref:Uncharacterized protein n=1 Tax=Synaphobranchus kaupii TaxID=118154 RepID=A0A9Q1ETI2_SYNKA|nr:hypothetical protein SKAU_G00289920 [Synaphobranchus kaupii]